MSWTPGPWQLSDDVPFVYALNEHGTNRFDAQIHGGHTDEKSRGDQYFERTPMAEVMASARLIAAAPDLYAACDRAYALITSPDKTTWEGDYDMSDVVDVIERLRVALAIARGEKR